MFRKHYILIQNVRDAEREKESLRRELEVIFYFAIAGHVNRKARII